MTVADTSALLAVVFAEPDAAAYAGRLDADFIELSAASLTEAYLVAHGRSTDGVHVELLDALIANHVDRIVPVDEAHARAAIEAWLRWGRGRHPAGLNYGDCLAYATAELAGSALLFKGDGFARTDIPSALA